MYLFDTDHMSLLERGGPAVEPLRQRLAAVPAAEIATTVVSYEEQLRGWLAQIAQVASVSAQTDSYHRLQNQLRNYCAIPVLPFDERAVNEFQRLWVARLRIGTMDLKIAAIALANNATLLTRNRRDFERVPALHLEDWSAA